MEFVSSELVKKLMEKVEFMEFVPFELAKELKEKGYKEKCFAYYFPNGSCLIFNQNPFRGGIVSDCLYSNNSLPTECVVSDFIDAPTIEQVERWLRKEKAVHIEIVASAYGYNVIVSRTPPLGTDLYRSVSKFDGPNDGGAWNSPEEAAIAGIEYTLNHLL